MPIILQCDDFVLSQSQVDSLWRETLTFCTGVDSAVVVRCVTETDIRQLNSQYRSDDSATNVLTFSYPPLGETTKSHDVVVCLTVAQREAHDCSAELSDYVALLLVHAFLHVFGFDHERSVEEAARTQEAERYILKQAGFPAQVL